MTEEQSNVPVSNVPAEQGEVETMGVREGMFGVSVEYKGGTIPPPDERRSYS